MTIMLPKRLTKRHVIYRIYETRMIEENFLIELKVQNISIYVYEHKGCFYLTNRKEMKKGLFAYYSNTNIDCFTILRKLIFPDMESHKHILDFEAFWNILDIRFMDYLEKTDRLRKPKDKGVYGIICDCGKRILDIEEVHHGYFIIFKRCECQTQTSIPIYSSRLINLQYFDLQLDGKEIIQLLNWYLGYMRHFRRKKHIHEYDKHLNIKLRKILEERY